MGRLLLLGMGDSGGWGGTLLGHHPLEGVIVYSVTSAGLIFFPSLEWEREGERKRDREGEKNRGMERDRAKRRDRGRETEIKGKR